MISTLKNIGSLPQATSKDTFPGDGELQMSQNKSGCPGSRRHPRASRPAPPSPQQLLQLRLAGLLQLQLLLDDLLHPGCVGPGLLLPGQLHSLQLIFLLQESLQDPPICLLEEGAWPWVGWSEPWC